MNQIKNNNIYFRSPYDDRKIKKSVAMIGDLKKVFYNCDLNLLDQTLTKINIDFKDRRMIKELYKTKQINNYKQGNKSNG